MTYDLHMHSHFSDGELSPLELVETAKKNGVTSLALTDHDTLSGLDQARQAANENDIGFINGIELSCTWRKQLLHVVGLNINPDDVVLREGVESNKQRRLTRAQAMFDDFAEHDIELQDEVATLLLKEAVPTRPHFAQALVNLGLAKDKKQAFKRYLVRGKPGFVPMVWPSLEDVVSWIRSAGGVAVLAHPLRYNLTRTKTIMLIEDMLAAGAQAIEVSTGNSDKQQIDNIAQLANEYGLHGSIGSDFHVMGQPWARLGGAKPLPKSVKPVWQLFE